MTEPSPFYLIVGLGNPGKAYELTRHNVGFRVLDELAKKQGWIFKASKSFQGKWAEGSVGEKRILLLKPETYMNESGYSIKQCVSYYKVPLTQMLVVSDDIYLPLGRLRIKTSGGSGGHNGLKSIESHLGTQVFGRLRVGVGNKESGSLSDYVLAPFLKEEEQKLPSILQRSVEALELWLNRGVVAATEYANKYAEEKEPEKKLGE